jgi:ankyrin repeat protein
VDLQLSNLCRVSECQRDREVEKALDVLPSGLEATYVRILEQIDSQGDYMRRLASKTFRWVMYAQRPLTTAELQDALATEELRQPGSDLELDSIAVILGACANLIFEDSYADYIQSIIRPIHYSVQEFFTRVHTDIRSGFDLYNIGDPCHVHGELATTCILYLESNLAGQRPCQGTSPLYFRIMGHPFLWYAACFFDYHLLRHGDFSEDLAKRITTFLHQPNSFLAAVLQLRAVPQQLGVLHEPEPWHDFDPHTWMVDMSTLVYATELYDINYTHAVWKDLQPPPYALHRACSAGLMNVISRLLADEIDVNEEDKNGLRPVYYASSRGNLSILEVLLSKGADVNAQGGHHGNALQAASYRGHEKIVDLLLSRGADAGAQGGQYGNALHAASYRGHEKIVDLLLNRGADANAQGGQCGNALQAASYRGHEKIVDLLLNRGADASAQGGCFGNALQAASSGGHEKIVDLLLSRGADASAQGGYFGNALQAASYRGHEKIVDLLLSRGADASAQGGYFGNALQAASYGGHEKIVDLLLSRGADANAQGGEYGNALQAASLEGHEKIVDLLLNRGADFNTLQTA